MKRLVGLIAVMLLAVLIQFSEAFAKDFGVHGQVFNIEEVDMLELIQTRLQVMEKSGDLEKHYKSFRDNVTDRVNQPVPAEGITDSQNNKTWEFDPTYVVQEDIVDHKGRILHRAGTRVNPLDTLPMPRNLLFINGKEDKQVAYAIDLSKTSTKPLKIVLTKGSPMELMKSHKIRIYFDQKGLLVRKLGIKQVPAFVEQKTSEARTLTISEIVVNDN